MSVAAADPMVPARYRIKARTPELGGEVFSWNLEPVDEPAPDPAPGQFNMLYAFGVGEVPISVSARADDGGVVHTIRDVGGVTRTMAGLRAGDTVGLRGPFGSRWPLDAARGRDLVLIAGGIGLAPLRPAVHHALAGRDAFRRVLLLYGARRPADILYRDEIDAWRGGGIDVGITVDRGDEAWRGHVGVVTRLIDRADFDPGDSVALICGPEVMMSFAIRSLERRGVATDRIHVSMERNMKCALGYCGHCQLGGHFVCKDGPVFRFDTIEPLFGVKAL